MKVTNLCSPQSGKPVPNQFHVTTRDGTYFQSYDTLIAKREYGSTGHQHTVLNYDMWNYSVTTVKYLRYWLAQEGINLTTKELHKIFAGDHTIYPDLTFEAF